MDNSVLFSHVMEEYGNLEKEKAKEEAEKDKEKADDTVKEKDTKKVGLIQAEERMTGSVAGTVYAGYFRFAGGMVRLPIILLLLACFQGASGTQTSVQTHRIETHSPQLRITCSWASGLLRVFMDSVAVTTWLPTLHLAYQLPFSHIF